jgi:hypothetical protein
MSPGWEADPEVDDPPEEDQGQDLGTRLVSPRREVAVATVEAAAAVAVVVVEDSHAHAPATDFQLTQIRDQGQGLEEGKSHRSQEGHRRALRPRY